LRRWEASGLAGFVVLAGFLFCTGSDRPTDPDAPAGSRFLSVTRVVDGDTFHVLGSGSDLTIRLIGIDTPEVGWYGGQAECYGRAAGRYVKGLLNGADVRLEFDADRIDPYGRTLAYAYLVDGRMLNVLLVRLGFAEVTIYEPNDRYEGRLRAAEGEAREAGRGLWASCR
jgi:micrococcal nuclease